MSPGIYGSPTIFLVTLLFYFLVYRSTSVDEVLWIPVCNEQVENSVFLVSMVLLCCRMCSLDGIRYASSSLGGILGGCCCHST